MVRLQSCSKLSLSRFVQELDCLKVAEIKPLHPLRHPVYFVYVELGQKNLRPCVARQAAFRHHTQYLMAHGAQANRRRLVPAAEFVAKASNITDANRP